MTARSRLRILVLGYLVRGPLGGLAWHYLQYVLGLARLGHDVFFLEDSGDHPSCYDPVLNVVGTDPTYGLAFAADAFERLGLGERWTYYDAHRGAWFGPAAEAVLTLCGTADVLLNVSCVNPLRSWMQQVPVRVLIDTDRCSRRFDTLPIRPRTRGRHHTRRSSLLARTSASRGAPSRRMDFRGVRRVSRS